MLLWRQGRLGINWDSRCCCHQHHTTDKINNKHATLAIKLHRYGCNVDQRPLLCVVSTPIPPLDRRSAVVLPAQWLDQRCARLLTVDGSYQQSQATSICVRVQRKYRPSTIPLVWTDTWYSISVSFEPYFFQNSFVKFLPLVTFLSRETVQKLYGFDLNETTVF